MKNWHKLLAFALMLSAIVLEACNRGYGCPGTDL
jgi:predicted small secreted protein